jgi:uncharacterized protein Veg
LIVEIGTGMKKEKKRVMKLMERIDEMFIIKWHLREGKGRKG